MTGKSWLRCFCLLLGVFLFSSISFGQSLDDLLEEPGQSFPATFSRIPSGATDQPPPMVNPGSGLIPTGSSFTGGILGILQFILSQLGALPAGETTPGASTTAPIGDQVAGSSPDTASSTTSSGSDTSPDPADEFAGVKEAELALEKWKGGALSPEKFFDLLGPICRVIFYKTGVPASVTLAQASVETGFGASSIGNAKNLFGIKGTGPAGSTLVSTREHLNGQDVIIKDKFRKYHTWRESIEDHGKFLQQPRYAKCLANKDNPDQFARELQKAGYATAPNYASALIARMKKYDLYKWDEPY
jgi:flagellum-specific peptidoglycan hydrolase FlgJ